MSTLQKEDENRAITLPETSPIETRYIYKNMKKKFSRLLVGFGAAQIIIGILCFVINGVTFGMFLKGTYSSLPILGYGFLTGLTFIAGGAIGVAAGKWKKKCLVVSSNVLCIISASFCLYLFICSVISVLVRRGPRCVSKYEDGSYKSICEPETDKTFALDIVLAILAFLEVGCAIGSSVVSCSIGSCCCDCDCGCCCPPIIPQKARGIGLPYQQSTTFVVNPSQPTYYTSGANQMTIPSGQQQPVILLNPNQMTAQYNPQHLTDSSTYQTLETSRMNSSTGEYDYEPLTLNTTKR